MKHYLNFINTIGLIEISEPFGFDGSTHKVEQGDNYGRDVVLGDEEIDLIITESNFKPLQFPQQYPNGVVFNYASQGFQYFKDILKNEGWEAEIEYIIEKDETQFSKGIIDGLTCIIEFEQIKFKVIQNTKREEVKRRLDVVIDAFSDKDLDDNDIEPCQTVNVLVKAKPIQQESEWSSSPNVSKTFNAFGLDAVFFSPFNTIISFGIDNTTTTFSNYQLSGVSPSESELQTLRDSIVLIRNENELSNTIVKISKLNLSAVTSGFTIRTRVVINYGGGLETGNFETIVLEDSISSSFIITDKDYEVSVPSLPANGYLWVQCTLNSLFTLPGATPVSSTLLNFSAEGLKISTTSTAIDSITKAVRYIDLLKHACTSVGLPTVNCPDYDIGGEHYDNFAFNGYLLGQITDKPFNNTLKDLLNVPKEINNGYQINPDNIEVLHYDEFYKDIEIGAFIEIQNLQNKTEAELSMALKTFNFNYKNSSKGRETNQNGSIDDIHGQTQWLYPSKKTDKNLKIEIDHIRSAFLIEEQRRRVFDNENTTSLEGDDKLYLIKTVSLPPSARGGFTATLLMQVSSTQLKIMANGFRWDLLGLQVGAIFSIDSGENQGGFFIQTIEPSILTLSAIGLTFNGFSTITVSYPLSSVNLVNQTNEGYTLIEGVANPDNYSNLDYSIGRNLKKWYSYLGACGRYLTGVIKNTMFEVNGNLVTRKSGEIESVSDSSPIDLEVIKEMRLVDPRIETVTVFSDFDTATEIFNKVATEKGYVRVEREDKVVSGFPKEMEYKWSTNELEMKLIPKKESEYYDVVENLVKSFQINNNIFVSLYDVNDILIVTPLRFDKIRINGVIYTDEIAFSDALTDFIQL